MLRFGENKGTTQKDYADFDNIVISKTNPKQLIGYLDKAIKTIRFDNA